MELFFKKKVDLIHNVKDKGTFHSAAHQKDYSPDLCLFLSDPANNTTCLERKILGNFPRSQHRPVLIRYGLSIPLVHSIPKPRWNFQKADWSNYSKYLDVLLRDVAPLPSNYDCFVKCVKKCI